MVMFFYFYSLGKKVVDKFTKFSKISFSMEYFTASFWLVFSEKTSKFGFWMCGWVLGIKSKYLL